MIKSKHAALLDMMWDFLVGGRHVGVVRLDWVHAVLWALLQEAPSAT